MTARCFGRESDWSTVLRVANRTEPSAVRVLGFAVIGERRIDLSPDVCRSLTFVRAHEATLSEEAAAIGVLAHESRHLVGVDGIESEAKTECYGMQRLADAAVLLGVPKSDAMRLPLLYLAEDYPDRPARYRSFACRNSRTFDLHPNDSHFP